jgi:hypothetical protein
VFKNFDLMQKLISEPAWRPTRSGATDGNGVDMALLADLQ